MFPIHNFFSLPFGLRWSHLGHLPSQASETFEARFMYFWDSIARNITLSCHPRGIVSNMCGAFWEPNITCNLVHAWLHPIYEMLRQNPGMDGDEQAYHRSLLTACAARRPSVASFLLGATLTGLMSFILHISPGSGCCCMVSLVAELYTEFQDTTSPFLKALCPEQLSGGFFI